MLIFCWCLKLRPGWPARPQGQYWLIIDLKLMLIFCWCLKLWLVTFPNISERPKGPFPLTAATVIWPQDLCLIAVITVTFGGKRIAAERVYCGRKRAFRPHYYWICSQNAHRKSRLRPKEHISAATYSFGQNLGYRRGSYGHKLGPKDWP